ncbi:MAG: hypothetical protein VKP62_07760 [Candidatus Sericytochromatia bacterium]|nr:hypothetical protein [Candidatus Sericytochromatia bacterium]
MSEPLVRVSGFVPDQEAQEELTPPASVSDSPELVSAPASPQAAAGGEVASAREQGAVAAAALQEPPARSSGQSPSAMLAKMAEALQAHAQLTERYAQAGYRIGKLEAEVKHLQLERQRMASRLAESEQTLADSRLNERVLEVERDRALAALGQAREELASAGLSLKASQPGVWNWLRRNW